MKDVIVIKHYGKFWGAYGDLPSPTIIEEDGEKFFHLLKNLGYNRFYIIKKRRT